MSEYGSRAAISLAYHWGTTTGADPREPISVEGDSTSHEEYGRIIYGGLPVSLPLRMASDEMSHCLLLPATTPPVVELNKAIRPKLLGSSRSIATGIGNTAPSKATVAGSQTATSAASQQPEPPKN
jgi:hypothetical protein